MKQHKGLIVVCVIGFSVLIYACLHLGKVDTVNFTPISAENTETQTISMPSITISLASPSVNKGDSFTINIIINPAGQNIAGAQFNLSFDSTLVSANNIAEGNLFGTNQIFLDGKIDNTTGTISNVACACTTLKFIPSQGTMVSISMTANNSGVCNLSLSNVIIANQQAQKVNSTINNSSITINA